MQRFTLVCQDTYLFLSVYLLTMQIIKLFSLFPVSSSHKSHKSCNLWLKYPFIYLLCAKLFSNVFFIESLHCFSSYTCLGSHADCRSHCHLVWLGQISFHSMETKRGGMTLKSCIAESCCRLNFILEVFAGLHKMRKEVCINSEHKSFYRGEGKP